MIVQKDRRINKVIELLESIELPQFIVQIYASGFKEQVQFWLMRSNNVKFNFSPADGLTSLNYEGYSVDEEYQHHSCLPWSQLDNTKCLILRKAEKGLKSCMHHRNIVLIPHQQIGKNGKIDLPISFESQNNLLRYDIHDNFLDIRSRSKLEQLHLAALVSSFEGGFPCTPLKLTNEEYAVSLLRSCYSNMSLKGEETNRLKNIVSLCIELNLNVLLLCCQVLLQASSILSSNYQYSIFSSTLKLT
jgi:hypothetical protein